MRLPDAVRGGRLHGTGVRELEPRERIVVGVDGRPRRVLTGVSCPTGSACAAVDESGGELGLLSGGWALAEADPGNHLKSVSCGVALSCVAVDANGNALGTESPSGGASAWHRRSIDSGQALNAVSCSAGGACVAVDGAGNALASADPGRAGAT